MLDGNPSDDLGWVAALADAKIGMAIRLMHQDVAFPWTVDRLAYLVAMSRSGFSKRFKSLVRRAPLDYLLHWRMRLARDYLRKHETVSIIAAKLGYASESAFGNAFKHVFGHAPKRYWKHLDVKAFSDPIGSQTPEITKFSHRRGTLMSRHD